MQSLSFVAYRLQFSGALSLTACRWNTFASCSPNQVPYGSWPLSVCQVKLCLSSSIKVAFSCRRSTCRIGNSYTLNDLLSIKRFTFCRSSFSYFHSNEISHRMKTLDNPESLFSSSKLEIHCMWEQVDVDTAKERHLGKRRRQKVFTLKKSS